MPARRRHYPGRGPAAGISGTHAAYDNCARPGCGHSRVHHLAGGPCTRLLAPVIDQATREEVITTGLCRCERFKESEE